jgi:hypothetical protein
MASRAHPILNRPHRAHDCDVNQIKESIMKTYQSVMIGALMALGLVACSSTDGGSISSAADNTSPMSAHGNSPTGGGATSGGSGSTGSTGSNSGMSATGTTDTSGMSGASGSSSGSTSGK